MRSGIAFLVFILLSLLRLHRRLFVIDRPGLRTRNPVQVQEEEKDEENDAG